MDYWWIKTIPNVELIHMLVRQPFIEIYLLVFNFVLFYYYLNLYLRRAAAANALFEEHERKPVCKQLTVWRQFRASKWVCREASRFLLLFASHLVCTC